jgi:hypothetical protein
MTQYGLNALHHSREVRIKSSEVHEENSCLVSEENKVSEEEGVV